ncbi:hypothetical protein Tco_1562199 [Tanacetum coccineum]
MDELIDHVSEKTYAYGVIRAENQNLLITISELKTRLANVGKGMNDASSVRRPMNRDSHVKDSVLANSKKPAKKVAVYVRKNKQTNDHIENTLLSQTNENDHATIFNCSNDTPQQNGVVEIQSTQISLSSPSTSSIIVDEHEAPPIATTSDEQTSPISLTEADEFNQEDSTYFDGNSQFVSYNPPSREEIESSTTALEP